ncbi:methionine aminopeptidase 2 [Purpureocillium lilacinum]|uniref:Methionine aminopeptidase 2 n=1 Tax=Purpureocillium lilacinum TaxID=33203 RepID=A0A179GJX0_PURLI|nr:methionine aminopeptidase 2 [Purpureocillium lilacinum]OAQ78176.1 methionine aminopeptidase 2 [Purpureocillium lilacinum]PWI73101.1 methionyl aminopeptidase [Purpureocillium lilacinum]
MGSKTPDDERHMYQDRDSPFTAKSSGIGGEKRGAHLSRDGDGCMAGDGGTNDDDDDDEEEAAKATAALDFVNVGSADASKKKKRKRPKRKNKAAVLKQSSPPKVALADLFPSGEYPEGEKLSYGSAFGTTARVKAPELRRGGHRPLEDSTVLNDYRKAAEVHRQVRQWVQQTVKPGQTLTEIATGIEDSVRALLGNPGLEPGESLKAGLGFPTGLALNNCVAHYTPNPGQKDIVLQHEDVMKVDFGVHINGWIVDSAFTMSFDPTYDNLLAAVRDATNTGIKNAGIDVRISDVSAAIQEAMESYEVEIRGKLFPVKPVRDLCGHDIKRYRIHGEKTIPFVKNSNQTKMEEGEVFAIETFGSTGRGVTRTGDGIYGYGLSYDAPRQVALPLNSANRLYKTIRENFDTIVFCRRYLDRLGCDRYLAGLNCLVSKGILEPHQPLMDIPGSYSAQFEHTILLRESHKEVISRGDDY